MSKKSVFCSANSEFQAASILDQLTSEGFSNYDISALFPDKHGTFDFTHQTGAKAQAIAGGARSGKMATGELKTGPFIAAGPILAALSVMAVDASTVGIAGGLIGLGLPEAEAKHYEGKIKSGNILLFVHTEDSKDIKTVEQIFRNAGSKDIGMAGKFTSKNCCH